MYDIGIEAAEALPLFLFIGIGAMIDFGLTVQSPDAALRSGGPIWHLPHFFSGLIAGLI